MQAPVELLAEKLLAFHLLEARKYLEACEAIGGWRRFGAKQHAKDCTSALERPRLEIQCPKVQLGHLADTDCATEQSIDRIEIQVERAQRANQFEATAILLRIEPISGRAGRRGTEDPESIVVS